MDLYLYKILEIVENTPNDMELGKKVRAYIADAKKDYSFGGGEEAEYDISTFITLHKSKLTEEEPERIKRAKDFFDKLEDEK